MRKFVAPILLVCLNFSTYAIQFPIYNINDYGAVGDGHTLDTEAINTAIKTASEAGGGTVYVPAGNYVSGSIHLKSHISLYLDQGAVLIATSEEPVINYDQAEKALNDKYQDFGHSHFHNSFIWGEDLQDVSIAGPGRIWGRGLVKDWSQNNKSANKAITFYRCTNIIMKDFTIFHGGWFAILATGVDNMTIDNLKIDTNRDGMDIDCCRNVRVANCTVNSPHDDGICLKSSFALNEFRATENVTITNCQLSGYDEGTLLDGTFQRTGNKHPIGRIKFGTESNGGFKNITISNCVFSYCRGLALETVDGGLLEDITINNITMRDIVNDPIFLRLGARMRGPEDTPVGELRRVIISNVIVFNADSEYACTISGIQGHNIKDLVLQNVKLYYKGGGMQKQSQGDVPENENSYPEPGMFGIPPAFGLFVRHAENIKITDVSFHFMEKDYRPALYLNDVHKVELRYVEADKSGESGTVILKNVTGFKSRESCGLIDQDIDKIKDMVLK